MPAGRAQHVKQSHDHTRRLPSSVPQGPNKARVNAIRRHMLRAPKSKRELREELNAAVRNTRA